tara:strand:- start:1892 stop:2011 length:120 start_codon:yes stop_codon:yes gene_type:complete
MIPKHREYMVKKFYKLWRESSKMTDEETEKLGIEELQDN